MCHSTRFQCWFFCTGPEVLKHISLMVDNVSLPYLLYVSTQGYAKPIIGCFYWLCWDYEENSKVPVDWCWGRMEGIKWNIVKGDISFLLKDNKLHIRNCIISKPYSTAHYTELPPGKHKASQFYKTNSSLSNDSDHMKMISEGLNVINGQLWLIVVNMWERPFLVLHIYS